MSIEEGFATYASQSQLELPAETFHERLDVATVQIYGFHNRRSKQWTLKAYAVAPDSSGFSPDNDNEFVGSIVTEPIPASDEGVERAFMAAQTWLGYYCSDSSDEHFKYKLDYFLLFDKEYARDVFSLPRRQAVAVACISRTIVGPPTPQQAREALLTRIHSTIQELDIPDQAFNDFGVAFLTISGQYHDDLWTVRIRADNPPPGVPGVVAELMFPFNLFEPIRSVIDKIENWLRQQCEEQDLQLFSFVDTSYCRPAGDFDANAPSLSAKAGIDLNLDNSRDTEEL